MVSEGRVEMKYRNEWRTICDDHWTLKEANVICRFLGFGSAAVAAHSAYFGRGIGKVKFFTDMFFNILFIFIIYMFILVKDVG